MKEQRAAGGDDRHREFDVTGIFRKIVAEHSTDYTRALPKEKYEQLPILLAETHRAASRFHLQAYPGVENTIRQLHSKYRLAIISDAQTPYALPELHATGLSGYFDPIIISGDIGYRKPDLRLFSAALSAMNMDPSEVLHVGNDMYRDIYGAQRLKLKTVFFQSNQGAQEREGVKPDYIVYKFPELLNAIKFFENN
jgi:putative hydrolase of the HAD superfamily